METPDVVLASLAEVLGDVAEIPLSCWSTRETADWLCGLQAVRSQIDGIVSLATTAAAQVAVRTLDGSRTLSAYVAGQTNSCPKVIGADVALARWLHEFAVIEAAFAAGLISRRHVYALKDLDLPRTRWRFREAQEYLVDAAKDCSWAAFVDVCAQWLLNADPDGELPKEQAHRRSCTWKTNGDGSVSGRFTLDTVTGKAVVNAIEREALAMYRADTAAAGLTLGTRSYKQRCADALAALITRGAGRPDGTCGSPLIHIVCGLDILTETIHRLANPNAPRPDSLGIDPSDPLRRCELVDGTPIHPDVVAGLLTTSTLRRLVLGANSEILDLGRTVRLFPRRLIDALLAAARGRCQVPGCDAPFCWLQADHIVPWVPDGHTSTDNAQIWCDPHNKAKSNRPQRE